MWSPDFICVAYKSTLTLDITAYDSQFLSALSVRTISILGYIFFQFERGI